MRIERFPVGPLDNNCYLLIADDSRDAMVVDPSIDSEAVLEAIRERGLLVRRILLTHAHFDHTLMVKPFHEATSAPAWLHAADRPLYELGREQAATWGFVWPGDVPIAHWIEDGEDVGIPGV